MSQLIIKNFPYTLYNHFCDKLDTDIKYKNIYLECKSTLAHSKLCCVGAVEAVHTVSSHYTVLHEPCSSLHQLKSLPSTNRQIPDVHTYILYDNLTADNSNLY